MRLEDKLTPSRSISRSPARSLSPWSPSSAADTSENLSALPSRLFAEAISESRLSPEQTGALLRRQQFWADNAPVSRNQLEQRRACEQDSNATFILSLYTLCDHRLSGMLW